MPALPVFRLYSFYQRIPGPPDIQELYQAQSSYCFRPYFTQQKITTIDIIRAIRKLYADTVFASDKEWFTTDDFHMLPGVRLCQFCAICHLTQFLFHLVGCIYGYLLSCSFKIQQTESTHVAHVNYRFLKFPFAENHLCFQPLDFHVREFLFECIFVTISLLELDIPLH